MQDFFNGFSGADLTHSLGGVDLLYGKLPSLAYLFGVLVQYVFYFGAIYYLVCKGRWSSESHVDYLKRMYRSGALQFRSESHMKWLIGISLFLFACFAYIQTVDMVETVTTYAQYAKKTTSGSKTAIVFVTEISRGSRRSSNASIEGIIRIDGKELFLHIVNANKKLANAFLRDESDGKLYTVTVYLDQDGQPYAIEPFLAE